MAVMNKRIDMCDPTPEWADLVKLIGLPGSCPVKAVSILYKIGCAFV